MALDTKLRGWTEALTLQNNKGKESREREARGRGSGEGGECAHRGIGVEEVGDEGGLDNVLDTWEYLYRPSC